MIASARRKGSHTESAQTSPPPLRSTRRSGFGHLYRANIEKVDTAMKEELAKLIADGVTQDELTAQSRGSLQSQKVRRNADAGLLNTLAT